MLHARRGQCYKRLHRLIHFVLCFFSDILVHTLDILGNTALNTPSRAQVILYSLSIAGETTEDIAEQVDFCMDVLVVDQGKMAGHGCIFIDSKQ